MSSEHSLVLNVRHIGEDIRDCRRSLGITQKELADRMLVAPSWVSDVENGKRNPGVELVQLALAQMGRALYIGEHPNADDQLRWVRGG